MSNKLHHCIKQKYPSDTLVYCAVYLFKLWTIAIIETVVPTYQRSLQILKKYYCCNIQKTRFFWSENNNNKIWKCSQGILSLPCEWHTLTATLKRPQSLMVLLLFSCMKLNIPPLQCSCPLWCVPTIKLIGGIYQSHKYIVFAYLNAVFPLNWVKVQFPQIIYFGGNLSFS